MFIEFSVSRRFLKFALAEFVRGPLQGGAQHKLCSGRSRPPGSLLDHHDPGVTGCPIPRVHPRLKATGLLVPGDADYSRDAVLGPGSHPRSLARS